MGAARRPRSPARRPHRPVLGERRAARRAAPAGRGAGLCARARPGWQERSPAVRRPRIPLQSPRRPPPARVRRAGPRPSRRSASATHRGPGGEPRAAERLFDRQRLDPECRRECDECAVNTVAAQFRTSQLDIGRPEREQAVGLAGNAKRPSLPPTNQSRRPAAPCQLGDQRLAEQMLMDVYLHFCLSLSRLSSYGDCW